MVGHRPSVLHELLLHHVPRRDVLIRSFVDLRIQMHSPRRTHDNVSLFERESPQFGWLHDAPHGHGGSGKTKGLLDRRVE